jgi:hypothetical protein
MASHEPSSTSVTEPQPLQLLFSDAEPHDENTSPHENGDENGDPNRRRSTQTNRTVSPTPPSPAPSSVKPVPRRRVRPPFRTPSSIHALQLSESASEFDVSSLPDQSPPFPFSSPAGRAQRRRHHKPARGGRGMRGASDTEECEDGGASDSTAAATTGSRGGRRRRAAGRVIRLPSSPQEEMPLVLLHVTVLPPPHAGSSCGPDDDLDPWAAATRGFGGADDGAWLGWSAETIEAHAPPGLRAQLRDLQARVGPAVLARGLLVPHPQGDFDALEGRVLEALGLCDDDGQPLVLPCGHDWEEDYGDYDYDDRDDDRDDDEEDTQCDDVYGAEEGDAPPSELPPLIVDDGFDDDTSSGRTSPHDKPAAVLPLTSSPAAARLSSMLPSVPCAPSSPAGPRPCPTCRLHGNPPTRGCGSRPSEGRWELTFYAANGLMRAGAWRAAWREMERVDVEIAPLVPPAARARLDAAEVLLRRDRARREEEAARAAHEEVERAKQREAETEELVRRLQAEADGAAIRVQVLESEVTVLRDERGRWLDVLAAQQQQQQQRQFRGHAAANEAPPPRPPSPTPLASGVGVAVGEDVEEERHVPPHHDEEPIELENPPAPVPPVVRRRVTFQTDPPSRHDAPPPPPPLPKVTHWRDHDGDRGSSGGNGNGEVPLSALLRNHVRILARDRRNHAAALGLLAVGALLWGLLCGMFPGASGGAAAAAVPAAAVGEAVPGIVGGAVSVGGGTVVDAVGGGVSARPASSVAAMESAVPVESVMPLGSAVPIASGAVAGKTRVDVAHDSGEDVKGVFAPEEGQGAAQSDIRLETSYQMSNGPEIVISPAE